MNEPHFFIFWLYNLEMHNLEMTKMDRTEPNPLCEYRWSNIQMTVVDYDKLTNTLSHDIENLSEVLSTVSITKEEFKCDFCPAGYKTVGHLTKHLNTKHANGETRTVGECSEMCGEVPCGKVLSSARALAKHVKTIHRTCSVCNAEFESHNEKAKHMMVHTFCLLCDKNFIYESKLKRHNSQKH